MARYSAPQYVDGSVDVKRLLPIEEHSKFRGSYAFFKNLTGAALAAGDTVDLFKLPPGSVRLIPYLSMLRNTAAAGATLSIGFRAYMNADANDPVTEAPNELLNARAITNAGASALSTTIKYDVFSKRGITVFATIAAAGLPNNGEIELLLPYLYE